MVFDLKIASTAFSIAWLTGAIDACLKARLPATPVLESIARISATLARLRITMPISATKSTTPRCDRRDDRPEGELVSRLIALS